MTGSDSRNRTIMSDQNFGFQQIKHTDLLLKDIIFANIFTKDSNSTLGNTFHLKKKSWTILQYCSQVRPWFTACNLRESVCGKAEVTRNINKMAASSPSKQQGTCGFVCVCVWISNSFTNNPSDTRDNFIMASSPCPQHKDRWSTSHCHLQQPHLNPVLLFAALSSTFHRCSFHQWTISAFKMSGFWWHPSHPTQDTDIHTRWFRTARQQMVG